MAEKNSAQTNRHYENNGHLAVNQHDKSTYSSIKRNVQHKINTTRMWADAKVMATQPNIGGALCEISIMHSLYHAAVWRTPAARVPCSNDANIGERKTWNAR